MNQNLESKKDNLRFLGAASGVFLILCGAAALLLHRLDFDAYLVFAAGAGLLAIGSAARKTVMIVLGCLLDGSGLGILIYAGPWNIPAANQKVLFMLCFALGWFLIPLFTRLFTAKTQWMALVPGALIAVLAGAVLVTNDNISWIMHELLLDRSASALIVAIDLILIGFALIVPWRQMVKSR